MRIFWNKPFALFARQARIRDAELCEAVSNVERGLIDADLGDGGIKQRRGQKVRGFPPLDPADGGRAGVLGSRKAIAINVRDAELVALERLAGKLLNYDEAALAKAIAAGVLMEVRDEQGQTIP